jgi:hypothetical protein
MRSIATTLAAALAVTLPLAAAKAEAPAKPYALGYFAGTWCVAEDGSKFRYRVARPDKLMLTRLDQKRIKEFGPRDQFTVVFTGASEFELKAARGNPTARTVGRIDGPNTFTFVELRVHDEQRKQDVKHPINTEAKRCR